MLLVFLLTPNLSLSAKTASSKISAEFQSSVLKSNEFFKVIVELDKDPLIPYKIKQSGSATLLL